MPPVDRTGEIWEVVTRQYGRAVLLVIGPPAQPVFDYNDKLMAGWDHPVRVLDRSSAGQHPGGQGRYYEEAGMLWGEARDMRRLA